MVWSVISEKEIAAFYAGGDSIFNGAFDIAKADGTVNSELIPNYRNIVYGPRIWRALNVESNAFGILPKTTWPSSGWRVKTDFAYQSSEIAIGETDSFGTPKYPPIQVVRAQPKIALVTFEISDVMEALAEVSQDDVVGTAEQLRVDMGTEFVKMVNRELLRKVIGSATDGSDSEGSEPATRFTSLDRAVASHAEAQAFGSPESATVYGIDRASAPWMDSVVKFDTNGLELTDELIRQTLAEVKKNGANTNVILTGYDTYAKLLGIYMNFVRYLPAMTETQVQFGVNGIQTAKGIDAGVKVAALYGIPVIQSVDVPSDGNGYLQRMYMLDLTDPEGYGIPRGSFSILRPPSYLESNNFVLMQKVVRRGAYYMAGELTIRLPRMNAKIRSILE